MIGWTLSSDNVTGSDTEMSSKKMPEQAHEKNHTSSSPNTQQLIPDFPVRFVFPRVSR